MRFDVTILGSNSAIPALKRNPTSQLVNVSDHYYLLDCGEGTQVQMRKYGIKFQRISCIFISHLHGDHYFGLIGLLNTMHLLGRENDIHIFSPTGLQEIIEIQMKVAQGSFRFSVHFQELTSAGLECIYTDKFVQVSSVPVRHKIPTFGFIIEEKPRPRNIKKSFIQIQEPSILEIQSIKNGSDFELENGEIIPNDELLEPAHTTRKYSFITDTKPSTSYLEAIKDSNLLYHEATFTEEFKSRAKETKHSTALQAGQVAANAKVKKLIIGHFSSRFENLEPLLNEAKEAFNNVELATEGSVFSVE